MEIWKAREPQIAENLIALWKQDFLEWYTLHQILRHHDLSPLSFKIIPECFSSKKESVTISVPYKWRRIRSKYKLISQHSTNVTEHSFLSMGSVLQPIFQMAITQVCISNILQYSCSMESAASDCQQHTYQVHEHLQKVLYSYFWIFDFLLYIAILNLFIYYHLASMEACS